MNIVPLSLLPAKHMAFKTPFCIKLNCKSHSAVGNIKDSDDVENMPEIRGDIATIIRQILKQPNPQAAIAVSKSLSLLLAFVLEDGSLLVFVAAEVAIIFLEKIFGLLNILYGNKLLSNLWTFKVWR